MRLIAVFLAAAGLAAAAPPALPPTVITADAMESTSSGTQTVSIFSRDVVVTGNDIVLRCDRLRVITSRVGGRSDTIGQPTRFQYLLATGHVRILQAEREATCGRAEVLPDDNKVTLTENPVVTDHGNNTVARGNELVLLRGQRKVTGTHVTITGPPIKDLGFEKNLPPPTPTEPSR